MSFDIKQDVCWMGIGTSAVCYYLIMLPALEFGGDWVGTRGYPPDLEWATGSVKGDSVMPDLSNYKVVVLQQPKGESWEELIKKLQAAGTKVVFEVDDYLHGVGEMEDHNFKDHYDKRALILYERCMRMCDAMIVSTDYIFKKYKKYNPNIYVCRNGIDLRRYELTKPTRKSVNVGWAGATGHVNAVGPWLRMVAALMEQRDEVNFISIGQNFADAIKLKGDRPNRTISIPFAAIEQYPSAMSMIDIALAPGGGGNWYRGKSDLRWLEASALGIPIIARPSIYKEIEHGVTGFHATPPHEMFPHLVELVNDPDLRERVGAAAKEHVTKHRSMTAMAEGWADALGHIAS